MYTILAEVELPVLGKCKLEMVLTVTTYAWGTYIWKSQKNKKKKKKSSFAKE